MPAPPDPGALPLPSETYDVAVFGGTAPGVVAAVRAAREGRRVALITGDDSLGGAFPSLGAIETHYRGARAPLLDEFTARIKVYYRERYGADSEQYRTCAGGMMVTFEPHVAERLLRQWVADEPSITWRRGLRLGEVERTGRRVAAARFRDEANHGEVRIAATAWIEASDEGDFMARAGARYRVGREARSEFGEPSAGRVFTRWVPGRFPRAAAEGKLNLTVARATTLEPLPASSGEGDDHVQSYSYRLCLTDDPANRLRPEAPPAGYDRARYAPLLLPPEEKERRALPFHHRFLISSLEDMAARDHVFHGHRLPNRKRSWNATNFTGAGRRYPEAGDTERRQIAQAHREHARGLMYFLQHDAAMPPELRRQAAEWGLARDEFVEHDHLPPHLYVREARRLVGRAVFTEHDARLAPGGERAPVHGDSVGITDFSLDSLACTTERLPGAGALGDGQFFQMEQSRPGQVSAGVLLPRDIDNLLVVTTVSATHVGWGAIRQTPTQMHLAESAAWAAVLAARQGIAPAELDVRSWQRQLVGAGVMISFFNDLDVSAREPWVAAAQLLGTRGFFPGYDADPAPGGGEARRREWIRQAANDDEAGEDAAPVASGRNEG